ncbi:MAG: response regulator [Thermodesulfovibrionales bacterium]|nr:response regulator [Thermodesulfovibrionales bacterium]MDP3111658.1 response regulator [Thermodesulfovibrionales bacterium]
MEKKGKILVLDDDPVVTLSCKRILGAEGYNIITVDRGEDAIKRISNEEFDLLISDIRLPDVNGITVLKESKIIQPKLDVVIITGYPTLEDAKESVRLGAFEYIEKPFTPDFMMNVAGKIFDQRGWILRKAFIDEFRNDIVSLRDTQNPVIFYKEGTWARPIKDGLWEVGFDIRFWLLSGQLMYIDIPEGLKMVTAGASFGKILSGSGQTEDLVSPMTGMVKETNTNANTAMSALIRDNLSEGWLLWLARVQPITV